MSVMTAMHCPLPTTTPDPLPNRRTGFTGAFDWQGHRVSVTVNVDILADNPRRPVELFIKLGKEDGALASVATDAGVLISKLLQAGEDLRAIALLLGAGTKDASLAAAAAAQGVKLLDCLEAAT